MRGEQSGGRAVTRRQRPAAGGPKSAATGSCGWKLAETASRSPPGSRMRIRVAPSLPVQTPKHRRRESRRRRRLCDCLTGEYLRLRRPQSRQRAPAQRGRGDRRTHQLLEAVQLLLFLLLPGLLPSLHPADRALALPTQRISQGSPGAVCRVLHCHMTRSIAPLPLHLSWLRFASFALFGPSLSCSSHLPSGRLPRHQPAQ